MTTNEHVSPGSQVHFLRAMTVRTSDQFLGGGVLCERGTAITLTAKVIELSRDRNGRSWLDLLGDDAAQLERWGEVRFRPGAWPGGPTWTYGSPDWAEARETARRAAWSIEDPQARARARKAVEDEFGPALVTSVQTAVYRGDDEPSLQVGVRPHA